MSHKDKLFFFEASKGYIFKVLIDVMSTPIPRGSFHLGPEGMIIREKDSAKTIMIDYQIPRSDFKTFKCKRKLMVSFNMKHVKGLLKNVKKKDSIEMFVDVNKPTLLGMRCKIESSGKNARKETIHVACQVSYDNELEELPDGGYKYPMVIGCTEFQKIKRLIGIGKTIVVKIQRSNYISFSSDAGEVFDSEIEFGELVESYDDDDDDIKSKPKPFDVIPVIPALSAIPEESQEAHWIETYVDGVLIEEKDVEDTSAAEKKIMSETYPDFYQEEFSSITINTLIKLPGVSTQMQFYAPTIPQFPLIIKMNACQQGATLGVVQVYIKTAKQIAFEESLRRNNEIVEEPTKVKAKRRKTHASI